MPKRVKQTKTPESPALTASVSSYMAAIGRMGGLVGGKARLKTMTKKARRSVAQAAAQARWGKRRAKTADKGKG
jgi:hypothetical protein